MYFKKIKAVYETMTVNEAPCLPFTKFSYANGVYESFKHLQNETKEHFIALHLSSKNALICIDTVAIGSLSAATVHAREVFKTALLSSAAALVLIHNHPSGDPEPSKEDVVLTKQLVEASKIIGIKIHDHIIIGEGYYSFMENGRLD
jgi:DNA repair protein RadC